MKASLFLLLAGLVPAADSAENKPSRNFLWYDRPARVRDMKLPWGTDKANNLGDERNNPDNPWERQALPIGNGRIGAMVFGGDTTERLALNEISLWSGGPSSGFAYKYGPEAGKDQFGCYLPFGDLLIDFGGGGETRNYTRSLDLRNGIARVNYERAGIPFKRTIFASEPAQVIVMHCETAPGKLNARLAFKPSVKSAVSAAGSTLTMSGTLSNGLEFEAVAAAIPQKGRITAKGGKRTLTPASARGEVSADLSNAPFLEIEGAQSLTIIISMATNYVMDASKNWKGSSPHARNKAILSKAVKKSPKELQKDHAAFYRSLFDRVKLDLGKSSGAKAALPTDQRIRAYADDPADPELESTVYQYGRYMLIAGSRPGNLPANLQGIWNNSVTPAWASDYHNNINLQMCYWGAEAANLSECHEPLLNYITAMAPVLRGATRSSAAFRTSAGGPVRGWTARTSQNIWGGSAWEWNIGSSAWYALHMWEHYLFTRDKAFLKNQAYPMMKEVCQFWEDYLKELGTDGAGFSSSDRRADLGQLKGIKAGTLVAPNGWSPEQGPHEDGVAHDQQLIWELFDITINAANTLKADSGWASQLARKRDRLHLHRISPQGYLQEWMIDRPRLVSGHRHTSHLFGVYPGAIISYEKTPEIAKAAAKSLELRGTTGDCRRSWTWPWRTALWARLRSGENAYEMVRNLIRFNMLDNMITTHPPLQFDGTYGITAGMTEMLLQSHAGKIELLPALPSAWNHGSVKGLKARGSLTVDITWKDGRVTDYRILSPDAAPEAVTVIVNGEEKRIVPSSSAPARRRPAAPENA